MASEQSATLPLRGDVQTQEPSLPTFPDPYKARSWQPALDPQKLQCEVLRSEVKDQLLQKYASVCPDLRREILELQAGRLREFEKAEQEYLSVLASFDDHSRSIWTLLNTDIGSISAEPSHPSSVGDVVHQIHERLDWIKNTTIYWMELDVHRKAAFTLCDIGETICSAEGYLGRVVQESYPPQRIPDMLSDIFIYMEPDLRLLRDYKDKQGVSFANRLEGLEAHATARGIMYNLRECVSRLSSTDNVDSEQSDSEVWGDGNSSQEEIFKDENSEEDDTNMDEETRRIIKSTCRAKDGDSEEDDEEFASASLRRADAAARAIEEPSPLPYRTHGNKRKRT